MRCLLSFLLLTTVAGLQLHRPRSYYLRHQANPDAWKEEVSNLLEGVIGNLKHIGHPRMMLIKKQALSERAVIEVRALIKNGNYEEYGYDKFIPQATKDEVAKILGGIITRLESQKDF